MKKKKKWVVNNSAICWIKENLVKEIDMRVKN